MEQPPLTLAEMLDSNPAQFENDSTPFLDQAPPTRHVPEGVCVECEDTPAAVICEDCGDIFCDLCFKAQHRKGKRTMHKSKELPNKRPAPPPLEPPVPEKAPETERMERDDDFSDEWSSDEEEENGASPVKLVSTTTQQVAEWFAERSKYIPLRLSLKERKLLRLLEAAANVSEYTDKVDILTWKSKTQRIHTQLQDICAILLGLVVATDYKTGQAMIADKSFKDNEEFFQRIFEIGRRHKIMNPEKMRTEYGKLIYLLQDSVAPEIQHLLGFRLVKDIVTVHSFLKERQCLDLLADPLMLTATAEIIDDKRKPRSQIQREIKQKEAAIETLARKYSSKHITDEEIKNCLYSIGDNNSYLTFNRDPVDKMIKLLTTYFAPDRMDEKHSLAIHAGMNGARLSHSHERQYYYVLQSLTLWREVAHDMFKLWYLAEQDLLSSDISYRLRDTGQGLNRVQDAPRISKCMSKILYQTQQKVGNWVGSSVIHLGDHNVPNALMFIDKYTQVSRILNPVVLCVQQIDELMKDNGVADYIKRTFGGAEECKLEILTDFFRHAFDGSGASNFFDAGSCVDGRLTSAWNWCNRLPKKKYYFIFRLTGFTSFDGDWQK